jgi:hydrogenase maturation factor
VSTDPFGACRDPFHCVTCSDEGVPMRVLAPAGEGLALCEDARGSTVEVMTALVGPVAAGERVLVHAGTALVRLTEEEPA